MCVCVCVCVCVFYLRGYMSLIEKQVTWDGVKNVYKKLCFFEFPNQLWLSICCYMFAFRVCTDVLSQDNVGGSHTNFMFILDSVSGVDLLPKI